MKSVLITCLTTLLITLAGSVNAASDSGTITFRGAITNGSCNTNVEQDSATFDCYDPASGKARITTANLKNVKSMSRLPVEVKVHWLNPEKTKGIMEVNYR